MTSPRGKRLWDRLLETAVRPTATRILLGSRAPLMRFVPSSPKRLRPRTEPPRRPWPRWTAEVPGELETQPGIARDPAGEDAAFARDPLDHWFHVHRRAGFAIFEGLWRSQFFAMPRVQRSIRTSHRTLERSRALPAVAPAGPDPEALKRELVELSRELGVSAIGVAAYDPRYRWQEYEGNVQGDRAVVLIQEMDYDATQTIPSVRFDRMTMSTYAAMMEAGARIAGALHAHGYRAHMQDFEGESVAIPYAVAAGLGQLGLNGQLLTPFAGPRCRIGILSTNAPLPLDAPVDYGIEGVCDRCRACVRRCPAKALSSRRIEYRGVTKPKLNTARCAPIIAMAHDCGVCIKVCPVQRYGLEAVLDGIRTTGRVPGRETDDLEGYDWIDGVHYEPGRRPPIPDSTFEHPDWITLRPPAR